MSAVPADTSRARADRQARRRRLGRLVAHGRRALTVFFVAFLIFLYVPTVLLIIFSFNDVDRGRVPARGPRRSKWYRVAFTDPRSAPR